jgi:hypothetical protein
MLPMKTSAAVLRSKTVLQSNTSAALLQSAN